MNKTLVIMAAGMGSRFGGGGSKQTASLGPEGQMLMEYSIHDAMLAGFDKFVFIISPLMSSFFPELIRSRIKCDNLHFAEQSFEKLPSWYDHPAARTKPYGTVAAIISAQDMISEPFAVINADDFYGRPAFADLAAEMDRLSPEGEACMLTYPLAPTLSHTGGVTRGICQISDSGVLNGLIETSNIQLTEDGHPYVEVTGGEKRYLPDNAPVSMNIFGFAPWMIGAMVQGFEKFLRGLNEVSSQTAEYPVPVFLDEQMTAGKLIIRATPTNSPWFGVTYQEDIAAVKEQLVKISELYR